MNDMILTNESEDGEWVEGSDHEVADSSVFYKKKEIEAGLNYQGES